MTVAKHYSDETLVAFLDGELPADEREQVEAAVVASAALAARVQKLDVSRPAIKSAFDALLMQAPPAPQLSVSSVPEVPVPTYKRRDLLVASVAAAFGLLAGLWFSIPKDMTWQEQAASYHALYGPETLASVKVDKVIAEEELLRVGAAIGKELEFAKLSGVHELAYKRAQVLRFGAKPLAQIAFTTPEGLPVALCIMPDGAEAQGLLNSKMSGLSVVGWSAAGFSYILIGTTEGRGLNDMAVTLQQAVGT